MPRVDAAGLDCAAGRLDAHRAGPGAGREEPPLANAGHQFQPALRQPQPFVQGREPTLDLLWTLLFTSLLSTGLANLLWFHLLTRRAATVVSTYVFLVPAFAVAFGALALGEPLTPALLVGGLLTLAGIALVTRAPTRR